MVRLCDRLHETIGASGLRWVVRRRAEARQHHRHRCLRRLRPGRGRHRSQHRSRADLQHHVHPEIRHRLHPLGECHRLPGMTPPVGSVLRLTQFHGPARQVANHGKRRRLDLHAAEGCFQFVQNRLNQSTVERPGRVQPPDPHFLQLESLRDRFNSRNRAADHLMGTVVSRDAQPDVGGGRVHLLHRRRHALGRCKDRGHAPLFHLRHQRPPFGGEPHPVFETEHACRLRRREFPDAVSDDYFWTDADARPERRQRTLQRVQGGLLPRRVAEFPFPSGPTEHHVQQGCPSLLQKDRLAAVQNRPRHRFTLVECLSHADPLTSLPSVGERHPGRCPRRRAPIRFTQSTKSLSQRFHVVEDHACSVIEVAPAHARSPCHVR